MPNWCYNHLYIQGDLLEIERFKKQAKNKNTDLSLAKFYPIPQELKNLVSPPNIVSEKEYPKKIKKIKKEIKNPKNKILTDFPITKKIQKQLMLKYHTDNWYDWCIKKWGTKWDVDATLENDDQELEYQFDSAWSPPVAWLEYTAKLYPKLNFTLKYEEEGMGFMGKTVAEQGKLIQDECIN